MFGQMEAAEYELAQHFPTAVHFGAEKAWNAVHGKDDSFRMQPVEVRRRWLEAQREFLDGVFRFIGSSFLWRQLK